MMHEYDIKRVKGDKNLAELELKIENRYTAGGDFLEAITKAFNN